MVLKKVRKYNTNKYIDSESGSLEGEARSIRVGISFQADYHYTFSEFDAMLSIAQGVEIKIMHWLAFRVSSGAWFVVNKSSYDDMAKGLGLRGSKGIPNTLASMVEKGMLIKRKGYTGTYMLSPMYVYRGSFDSRMDCIKELIRLGYLDIDAVVKSTNK